LALKCVTNYNELMKRSWVSLLLCVIGLTACGTVTPAIPATPSPAPTILPTITTATSTPIPSPTLTPTLTIAPLNLHPQVIVLATNLPGPDDLLLAPDNSIYISDVDDGTIKQYTRDGQVHVVVSGLDEPEGMVVLPDGSLVIAEQGRNRLVRYDFKSGTYAPLLNFENNTKDSGVDGIGWDGSSLIIPDSPNGRILSVSPDGKTVSQLASGFSRPTDAWVESDGNILITDENANALIRLHADGTREKLADLSIPDDVVEDAAGNIFVVTLGDGAIHAILAGTNQDVVLVGGLGYDNPQGIVFDSDGNLIVTDQGHHRLLKVLIR